MKKAVLKVMAILLVCILALSSCSRKNLKYGIEFYGGDPAYQGVRDITFWAGKHVEIPSEYKGLPVKSLDDDAWFKLPSIYETLILPETIEQIDRDFYDNASRHLKYNEYDNAYYLGTKDNPYFALIKVKTADTPTASAMSYVIDDIDSVNKETPVTPPFEADRSDITSCVIHPDTRVIAGNAFEGCTYLKSITIPGSIKIVPEFAFAGCTSLESVVLEEGVEEISWYAFFECYALKSISLPSTLTELGGFNQLINLESIVIPEGVTRISDYAFAGCENLKHVTLPSSIVYIGSGAFDECTSLESIDIPNSIDYIGEHAFRNNKSLTDIKIPIGFFEKCKQNAFLGTNITNFEVDYSNVECIEIGGNLYDKNMTTLIKYCGDPSVKSFLVPQYIKKIAEFAFKDSSLEEIVLPKNLTHVGIGAFYNCDELKHIDLTAATIKYIGDYAFTDCDNLLTCQLRSLDDYEYSGIFDSCDSLQTVKIYGFFNDLSVSMFDECPALENIFIVEEKHYDSDNGILYKNDELIFYPQGRRDQTFTVPDWVDGIDKNAFKNHKYLEKVIISGSSCYIGDSAFEGCQALREIEIIGNSALYIGDRAFKDCISLKEIVLNDNISHIGESAFEGCTSLERAVLGNGLKNIYANTFRNCSSLKSVDLRDPKLLFIMEGAFIGCFELESIVIPNYCLNIQGIVFEEQVQIYYNGTVQECGWESDGWSMMKRNCEDGFFIICTDGNFYMEK